MAESRKLAFVDVARGLAILLVIWVHHGQVFSDLPMIQVVSSYGQLGVQLFFLASAFTLCMSSQARRNETGALRNFMLRRFFRIAPLYYLGLLVYFSVSTLASRNNPAADDIYTAGNVALNLLFVHGFSPSAYNGVVPGGWSIGAEMAFYALFPALILAMAKTYSLFGNLALIAWPIAALAFDATVMAILCASGMTIENNSFLYYNIANQLPVFIIGMAAFVAIADGKLAPSPRRDGALFALLTIIAFALLHPSHIGLGAAAAAVLLPSVAGLSFVFLLNLLRMARPNLATAAIGWIGQLSYSMYIFHFLFAWTATGKALRILGGLLPQAQALLYLPSLIATMGASALVALISKRLVEDRFIAIGRSAIRALNDRDERRLQAEV